MRKLISAVTSLAMSATMVSVIAPTTVSAAEGTRAFQIKTYAEADSPYAASGSTVKVSSEDVAKGNVVIPCAVYLDEATPTASTYSVQLTVKDNNPDAGKIEFKYRDSKNDYHSQAKSYTIDGVTGSSKQPITFAGAWDEDDTSFYIAHGTHQSACMLGQKAASTENYYMAMVWTNGGYDYKWTGEKSTDHPLFVFDVTLPQGISDGDYELVFCDYDRNAGGKTENPSCVVEYTGGKNKSSDGSLKLETMTITVGDGGSVTPDPGSTTTTSTTTKPPTTTTTTTDKGDPDVQDPGDSKADIVFDFGNHRALAGEEVKVEVKLYAHSNPITAMDLVFNKEVELVGISKTAPCLNRATINPALELPGLNFPCIDENSDGIVAEDGGTVFTLTYKAPSEPGTYKLGFGDKVEVFKDNTAWTYSAEAINGVLVVEGPGTSGTVTTTSTTTKPPVTTTTTTNHNPDNDDFVHQSPEDSDADIVFDFDNYEVDPGDEVKVEVKLYAHSNPITAMDLVFNKEVELVGISKTAPCLNRATINPALELPGLNFPCIDENSDGIVAEDGGTVFTLTYKAPTEPGLYRVGFGDKVEVFKDNTAWTYTAEAINGWIKVRGPVTSGSATTTTTTTTSSSTTTTVTTTPPPTPDGKLTPVWGDANCDGVVNVGDVVVLNRHLNGTLTLTNQGIVNADVVDPQDPNGGAVDPSKADLTMYDSDAIIRNCINLVKKLPITTAELEAVKAAE